MRNKQRLDRIERHVDNRRLHSSDLESLWPPLEAEFEAGEPMVTPVPLADMEEMIDQAVAQLDAGDWEAFARYLATDQEWASGVLPDDPISDSLYKVFTTEMLIASHLAVRVGQGAVVNHRRIREWVK